MKAFIKKFKTIENLTIQIPATIEGGNGIGKSTILEAISFVLTGKNINGKEFDQVYRCDEYIHDQIADVSFFDNYGNEFQRIVKPIFQTGRDGVESVKIKRSTECRKNGIVCNDFSDEFKDFYKFGTDYFFNKKEDVQRTIFIDLLKSKLPEFDVAEASLKLKSLKKSQKVEVDSIKELNNAIKSTKNVEVPTISEDLEEKNKQYLSLLNSSNPELIQEINKRNNIAIENFFSAKNRIQKIISDVQNDINVNESSLLQLSERFENAKKAKFESKQPEPAEDLEARCSILKNKLAKHEFFQSLNDYAQKFMNQNPVVCENIQKIKDLKALEFKASGEESSLCPLNGQFCETAKSNSIESEKKCFEVKISYQIDELKIQNKQILLREMQEANSKFNSAKDELSTAERKLNLLYDSNNKLKKYNELLKLSFDRENKLAIDELTQKISTSKALIDTLKKTLHDKKSELEALKEPELEKLPEEIQISEDLKQAHNEFTAIERQITGALAINENNLKLNAERSIEIKTKQANLFEISQQITVLTADISDYFSNLDGVIKNEFSGKINIGVELLEYVMSRDEYADCFKITANGKVFPYECNGALRNNVKFQILANMQRLAGYNGVTLMDECEGNTTQPIDTCGTNAVIAIATNSEELIIK